MTTLDQIQARADAATEAAKAYNRGGSELRLINRSTESAGDVPRLIAALRAVEDWCETNQHPTTDYPEGFSRQDYALDDAARRIRTAIQQALDG